MSKEELYALVWLQNEIWNLSGVKINERIAFAIVPDEVRYPDRIVGIALLLSSMQ